MAYKLTEIPGIRAACEKLADAGVKTTQDLLTSAGAAAGRKALADKTNLSEARILEWVNRADLMRIRGVGEEFSDLLEESGVDTVRELATRVPATLQAMMTAVNKVKKLTRREPNLKEVEAWVTEAKTLAPMVSH